MPEHTVATRDEWLAARLELLEQEKDLTRRSDDLARRRRALPWVPVENAYTFESDEGTKNLAGLFDGRSQLLVFHFMFGPSVEGWPEAGCPATWQLLDRTPEGRDDAAYPDWPRRHDEY